MKLNRCIVCGSYVFKIRYKGNIKVNEIIDQSNFMFGRDKIVRPDIIECTKCRFAWSNFDYDSIALKELYGENKNDYFDEIEPEKIESFTWIYREIMGKLPDMSNSGKIFDIGAFTGVFLNIMKNSGWTTSGLEISKQAVRYAKLKYDINIIHHFISNDLFEIKKLVQDKYDVVTALDVIEHLADPSIIFKIGDILLTDNGCLVLSMPNYMSINRKLSGKSFNLFLIEHIWYFSPQTIRMYAKKFNYEPIMINDLVSYHSIKSVICRLSQYPNLKFLANLNFPIFNKILMKIKRGDMVVVLKKTI